MKVFEYDVLIIQRRITAYHSKSFSAEIIKIPGRFENVRSGSKGTGN